MYFFEIGWSNPLVLFYLRQDLYRYIYCISSSFLHHFFHAVAGSSAAKSPVARATERTSKTVEGDHGSLVNTPFLTDFRRCVVFLYPEDLDVFLNSALRFFSSVFLRFQWWSPCPDGPVDFVPWWWTLMVSGCRVIWHGCAFSWLRHWSGYCPVRCPHRCLFHTCKGCLSCLRRLYFIWCLFVFLRQYSRQVFFGDGQPAWNSQQRPSGNFLAVFWSPHASVGFLFVHTRYPATTAAILHLLQPPAYQLKPSQTVCFIGASCY